MSKVCEEVTWPESQSHRVAEPGSNLEWWGRDSFYYCFNIWHWNFPRERNVVMIYCCLVAKSCLTLCNPMDCRPPSSSVHEISQTRILAWIAISFSSSNGYVWWKSFFFFLIYFCLCWFFIAACRLSLVVESRATLVESFSLQWLLLLSTGSRV